MPTADLQLHGTIKYLTSADLPLYVTYLLDTGNVSAIYTTNGSFWHDVDDSATSSGVVVNGTTIDYPSAQVELVLGSSRVVKVTYRLSENIPGYPGRRGYWLEIDDM